MSSVPSGRCARGTVTAAVIRLRTGVNEASNLHISPVRSVFAVDQVR